MEVSEKVVDVDDPYIALKTEIVHLGLANLVKNTVALHEFTVPLQVLY